MVDTDESEDDQGGVLGFFDADGGWSTLTELENRFGDELETSVEESLEALEDIGMLNVRRNDDGEIVTAQLSQFAADLYEAENDAEAALVYAEHGREPPEDKRKTYAEALQESDLNA